MFKQGFLQYIEGAETVGVDPGVSTGFATCIGQDLTYGGVFLGLPELAAAIRKAQPQTVVMEDFLGSRRWAMYKRPIEVIGAVKLVCEELGVRLVLQSPAVLQNVRLKARVESAGIESPHVRSAYLHVLHFLHVD